MVRIWMSIGIIEFGEIGFVGVRLAVARRSHEAEQSTFHESAYANNKPHPIVFQANVTNLCRIWIDFALVITRNNYIYQNSCLLVYVRLILCCSTRNVLYITDYDLDAALFKLHLNLCFSCLNERCEIFTNYSNVSHVPRERFLPVIQQLFFLEPIFLENAKRNCKIFLEINSNLDERLQAQFLRTNFSVASRNLSIYSDIFHYHRAL